MLILAFAAIGGGWTGAKKRFFWFWVGTAIVTLLWALGGSTPFFQLIYALVPGTKFFRAPSTIFFITTFATAIMAALGTERLLAGEFSTKYVYATLIGAVVITLFALVGGFTVLGTNIAGAGLADRVDANAADVKVGALRSLLFAGLTSGVIILLMRRKLTAQVAGWALVALVVVDLWSVERLYWSFSEPAATLYKTDTTIEFVKKLDQPVRILTVGSSDFPMAINDANLAYDGLHGAWVARRVRLSWQRNRTFRPARRQGQ